MKTPVLFLIFNRPDLTRRVFAEIRRARPERLFIAADGPRADRPDDARLCAEARSAVEGIDWPCQVERLYRDSNLGCKRAVSSAIDWFFGRVEEGIILEDDCLPDQSFFPYCEELLERYRDDERVMIISGFDAAGEWPGEGSYLFSKYIAIWGWATWKRAWSAYDVSMASWADPANKELIRKAVSPEGLWPAKRWTYDRVYSGAKDTWDYQLEYAVLRNSGLSIAPRRNLIENIGFGARATHATAGDAQAVPARSAIGIPLSHPSAVAADRAYDMHFTKRFRGDRSLMRRISARIRSWLG